MLGLGNLLVVLSSQIIVVSGLISSDFSQLIEKSTQSSDRSSFFMVRVFCGAGLARVCQLFLL